MPRYDLDPIQVISDTIRTCVSTQQHPCARARAHAHTLYDD